MKTVEPWKTKIFFAVLIALAFVVNLTINPPTPSPTASPPPITSVPPPAVKPPPAAPAPRQEIAKTAIAKPAPPPEPVKPRIWPGDFEPTRVIRIPDPDHPSTGVMDITFKPGDDIKLEAEQWWTIRFQGTKPEELENSFTDMDEFKKAGMRSVRARLKNGIVSKRDVRFVIERKNPDDFKPLPRVESASFRNVRFDFRSLQSNNGHVIIDFEIVNTDDSKTVGVALHGPSSLAYASEVAMIGSLTDSDGGEYFIGEMTGIKSMHTVTANLAAIAPHETRNVSLAFIRRSNLFDQPGRPSSFTLRSEVVINGDMRASSYQPNYVSPNGTLPSGCRIESLVWRIPVRYNQE